MAAYLSLLRHAHFDSAEDLAMFDQMLWNVRQGRGLVTSISGNMALQFPHHFFGEHVSPILYLLAWPAGLTRGPEALLVIQALAFAAAAIPLQRLTMVVTGSARLATGMALLWLIQPPLWGAVLYDFHMEAFEGFFLLSFALAFLTRKRSAWLWAALYVACKEDAPMYLAPMAILLGWQFGRMRAGLVLALAAGLYTMAAVLWIGPMFSPAHASLLEIRLLTPQQCGGVGNWLREVFCQAPRWTVLLRHLLTLGLLPLAGGLALIPAAMAVGLMWVSVAEPQVLLAWHYPFTTHPLLMLAAVVGLPWLLSFGGRLLHPWLRVALAVAVVAVAAIYCSKVARSMLRYNQDISLARAASWTPVHREIRDTLAAIPADKQVAAQQSLTPHVARRESLAMILGGSHAQTLVLPLDGRMHPIRLDNYIGWLDRLRSTNSVYGVTSTGGGQVLVLERGAPTTRNADAQLLPLSFSAEDGIHATGRAILDPKALNGRAWLARPGRLPGIVFDVYAGQPLPGRYRVGFRVHVITPDSERPSRLEVNDRHSQTLLAHGELNAPTDGYVWMELEITAGAESDLELRCWSHGRDHLRLDRVRWQRLDVAGAMPY